MVLNPAPAPILFLASILFNLFQTARSGRFVRYPYDHLLAHLSTDSTFKEPREDLFFHTASMKGSRKTSIKVKRAVSLVQD